MTYYKIGHTTVSFYLLKIAEKRNYKKNFQSIFTLWENLCAFGSYSSFIWFLSKFTKDSKKKLKILEVCVSFTFHFIINSQITSLIISHQNEQRCIIHRQVGARSRSALTAHSGARGKWEFIMCVMRNNSLFVLVCMLFDGPVNPGLAPQSRSHQCLRKAAPWDPSQLCQPCGVLPAQVTARSLPLSGLASCTHRVPAVHALWASRRSLYLTHVLPSFIMSILGPYLSAALIRWVWQRGDADEGSPRGLWKICIVTKWKKEKEKKSMDSKSSCTKMHFQSHVLGTIGSAPLRLCTCTFVYEGFDQNQRAHAPVPPATPAAPLWPRPDAHQTS